MKKENIEKIAKVVAEEYSVSDKVGKYLANITVQGLEKGMAKIPFAIMEKLVEDSVDEEV